LKRETFETRGLRIETSRDWSGRFYVAWRPNVSMFFRDRKALTKWAGYPQKTATRDSLLSWLDSLDAADAAREIRSTDPQSEHQLSEELLATGFGPEVFLDESDPNHQTRSIT
jgi:hypothetical protein